jgi:methylated-DNA-[protein]-cysteine S-methyltransferase
MQKNTPARPGDTMNYLIKTRLGWCGISAGGDVVRKIVLPSRNKRLVTGRLDKTGGSFGKPSKPAPAISRMFKGLRHYFNGEKVDFACKIDLRDYSAFERAVYKALAAIPRGQVRTYRWVASKIGRPGASRAVGTALAKNPLPVIIPCHRVIKSDGSPGNFSAIGGTKLKEKLLELERDSRRNSG